LVIGESDGGSVGFDQLSIKVFTCKEVDSVVDSLCCDVSLQLPFEAEDVP
jgi:hypothetical protein